MKVIRQPAMILIDVDGTLVDSVPDLAFCIDEMMERLGRPVQGEASVREWVGNGVEKLVKRALTGELEKEPDKSAFDEAYPVFLELYKENTCKRSYLYNGVQEGLDFLKSESYKLGCVTNKAARFTEPLLKELGIYDYFEIVISGDTLPKRKPDPMPLMHAAEFFKVQPENALMLGDSVSDVKAARAAGFQIACMSYGYNHGNDIRKSEPDAVLDSMAQLRDLLGSSKQKAMI